MRKLPLSRRSLLTATALGAVTVAGGGRALAAPRGRRTGPVGTRRTTATAAAVTAVPLGDLNGLHMWQPTVVNARGDVIGSSTISTPVVWSGGVLAEPRLPAEGSAYLEDLNDQGQFVGGFRDANDQQFAVAWPDGIGGEAILVDPSPEFRDSRAFFINNNGQVVYKAINVGEYTDRTFLYDLNDGSRTEILPPPNLLRDVYPRGLNDAGQFVSSVWDQATQQYFDFFWEDGAATDLPVPGIGTIQYLTEAGDVLVEYRPPAGYPQRAYVWRKGTFTDIPTLGEYGLSLSYTRQPMNDHGDVIGTSETADGFVPFLYTGGRTTQLPAPADLSPDPLGLNNSGLIVGRYEFPDTFISGACLWQNGSFLDVGLVDGFGDCQGMLATEQGEVLAFASDGPGGETCTFLLTVN